MSDWSCPSCDSKVSSFEVTCGCGFTKAELEMPPFSEAAPSRRVAPPAALFPWLGRALVVLEICAVLGAAYGLITVGHDVFRVLTLPPSAKPEQASTLMLHALTTTIATVVSFIVTYGLIDAGKMLQGIHRRVGALDERERASG